MQILNQFENAIREYDKDQAILSEKRRRLFDAERQHEEMKKQQESTENHFIQCCENVKTARAYLVEQVASNDRHREQDPELAVHRYDTAIMNHGFALEKRNKAIDRTHRANKRLEERQEQVDKWDHLAGQSTARLNMLRRRLEASIKTPEERLTEALTGETPPENPAEEAALLTSADTAA